MSFEALLLHVDLNNGCSMYPSRNGAPCIIMPRPGGPIPLTQGQVSAGAVHEVLIFRIAGKIRQSRQLGRA